MLSLFARLVAWINKVLGQVKTKHLSGKEMFAFFKSIAEQLKDKTSFLAGQTQQAGTRRMGKGGGGFGSYYEQEDNQDLENEDYDDYRDYGARDYGMDYGGRGWDYYNGYYGYGRF